jgi:hypothetical protein
LCRAYGSGELSAEELAYTADVLQLAERVEIPDPSVAEHLAMCTDPEINGALSRAQALALAAHYNAPNNSSKPTPLRGAA